MTFCNTNAIKATVGNVIDTRRQLAPLQSIQKSLAMFSVIILTDIASKMMPKNLREK